MDSGRVTDDIRAKAFDPNSDWPEPPLTGSHRDDVLRTWVGSPKKKAHHPKGRHKSKRGGETETSASELVDDPVQAMNDEVGGFIGGLERHTGHSSAQGVTSSNMESSG